MYMGGMLFPNSFAVLGGTKKVPWMSSHFGSTVGRKNNSRTMTDLCSVQKQCEPHLSLDQTHVWDETTDKNQTLTSMGQFGSDKWDTFALKKKKVSAQRRTWSYLNSKPG